MGSSVSEGHDSLGTVATNVYKITKIVRAL